MRPVLLGVFLALVALEGVGLLVLKRHGRDARFEAASTAAFDSLGREESLVPLDDTAFIRSVLPDSVQDIEAILRWTMNRTGTIGDPGPIQSAREIYELATSGAGLVCGPLARLFTTALAARGHTAREVQLARSVFSARDTHVTVEVLVDADWVVYDPTFHVTFRHESRRLGAADIWMALLEGTADEVVPEFLGPVRYPARIESYYLDWRPLYNTIAVLDTRVPGFWAELPPFRYWYGPRWYALARQGDSFFWHAGVAQTIYAIFIVGLPSLLLAIALVLAALTWYARRVRILGEAEEA